MIRFHSLSTLVAFAVLAGCAGGSPGTPPVPGGGAASAERAPVMHAATLPTYQFVDLGAGPNGGAAEAFGADKTNQGGNYIYTHDSCGKDCSFPVYHAVAWAGSGSAARDINPPIVNFAESWVRGGTGTYLVGYGVTDQGGYFGVPHALFWKGSTYANWKDLNPAGDQTSYAYAVNAYDIVGSGGTGSLHALMWPLGNLSNPIDLHPGTAYNSSEALGIYQGKEVGYAMTAGTTSTAHAMMWSGTAASAVDLTPSNVTNAYAYAAGGTTQAGCGVVAPATAQHALLWGGSASTMKDLNPSGYLNSCARAVQNGLIAGLGVDPSGVLHALLWGSGGKSMLDLNTTLPSGYTAAEALNFDPAGNIVGTVWSTGGIHGAMWMKL
jgi:hypothetical protein